MIEVFCFFMFVTWAVFAMTGERHCPFCGMPESQCDCPYGDL